MQNRIIEYSSESVLWEQSQREENYWHTIENWFSRLTSWQVTSLNTAPCIGLWRNNACQRRKGRTLKSPTKTQKLTIKQYQVPVRLAIIQPMTRLKGSPCPLCQWDPSQPTLCQGRGFQNIYPFQDSHGGNSITCPFERTMSQVFCTPCSSLFSCSKNYDSPISHLVNMKYLMFCKDLPIIIILANEVVILWGFLAIHA